LTGSPAKQWYGALLSKTIEDRLVRFVIMLLLNLKKKNNLIQKNISGISFTDKTKG